MLYNFFCGGCGRKFTSDTPERDQFGALNDIWRPHCGDSEIYTDDAAGRDLSLQVQLEYESKIETD